MWIEHPKLKDWKDSDEISYEKFPYTLEIIKTELINRHPNDILVGGLESKRLVDWPRILLTIILMFELL